MKYDFNDLKKMGMSLTDSIALRKIAMRLHSWWEAECGLENYAIERDEQTGQCYSYNPRYGSRTKIRDCEAGALKRLKTLMANYPELDCYCQTDPRGAPLYIYKKDNERLKDSSIESIYNSIGVAVYK